MTTRAQLARLGLFRAQQEAGPPPPDPELKLAPSSQYNGTARSGYGGAFMPMPVDPARTGPKTILRSLNIPRDAFTSDMAVVYASHAYGETFEDVELVRISCEGAYADVRERRWWPYTTANGETDYCYGFGVKIDFSACMAASTTGTIQVCAEAVARTAGIQNRVVSEIFYPRAAGIGADKEFDIRIEVDPKLAADEAGVRYRNIKDVLSYIINNGKFRPQIVYTRAYDPGDPTTRYAGLPNGNTVGRSPATSWATIEPAPGVDVMIGDGTITGASQLFDGIKIRTRPASSLTIETAMCGTTAGVIFRSQASSLGAFMLDGIKLTTGAFPAALGGTGDGARALRYGDQAQSRWATHAGNAKMQIITRNVDADELSAYGVGFGLLHLNDTLHAVSGSGVENVHGCVHGMEVSEIGGIQTGLRTKNLAFKLIPDPSIVNPQFEKKGPTGYGTGTSATAAQYGLYAYGDNVPTQYMPLDGSFSPSVTMVPDVVAYINANWLGWTATPADPASILNAPHLIDADTVVSAPIAGNSPWGGVARRPVPADGLQLYTCKDIHSNVIVASVGGNFENVIFEMMDVYDIAGSAHISLRDAMKDTYIGFSTFQDRSTQYGVPGENEAQPSLINSSGTSNKKSHLIIDNISMAGPKNTLLLGPATAADDFCIIRGAAFDAGVTVHPGLTNNVKVFNIVNRALALPTNAVGSVYLTTAVPPSDMYVDYTSARPDFTPKTALTLPNGKAAGARAPVATEGNHGWNIPEPV